MRMMTKRMARFRDRARKAVGRIHPLAAQVDANDAVSPEVLGALWDQGLMTLTAPRESGGGGATLLEAVISVEEVARASGAAALLVLLQAMAVDAIARYASPKKAETLLGEIVDRRRVLAFALSEPEPEPNSKPSVTTARKVKSEFVLKGRKTYVSGAREADLVIIFAATNARAVLKRALSAFLAPLGCQGMLPGTERSRGGLRGVPAVDLVIQNCHLPASSLIGKRGQGYEIARASMVRAAPLAAALSSGLLAQALDHVVNFARSRGARSAPLSEAQALELMLAEMTAGLDTSLALAWAAAGALEEDAPEAERLAREAKWIATEAAVNGIDQAARIMGIEGSIRGSLLERLSRDARAAQLVLGPNHLHRIEVARKIIRGR